MASALAAWIRSDIYSQHDTVHMCESNHASSCNVSNKYETRRLDSGMLRRANNVVDECCFANERYIICFAPSVATLEVYL
eukprot:SAG31_NODE_1040_length_10203_cov_3.045428_12_plen_80_part_00